MSTRARRAATSSLQAKAVQAGDYSEDGEISIDAKSLHLPVVEKWKTRIKQTPGLYFRVKHCNQPFCFISVL